jgi:hypothetical protein
MKIKGWKPMPVILKIIWIILIVETFFSLPALLTVYNEGFNFMSFSLFGMFAVDVLFILKIAMPIVLIIGMHQRYGWVWIYGLLFYLIISVNGLASIANVGELTNKFLEQMPDIPEGITEEMYYSIIRWALITSLVTGSLFNIAIMVLIYIKRKYFIIVKHIDPPAEGEMLS